MKAVCLSAPRKIDIIDVPEPELGHEDVLVEVRYVGLCGTDLHSYKGTSSFVSYPRIPGHEVSGIIADVGKGVPDSIHIGDKVMLAPYLNCGACPACRAGRPNCCQFNQTMGVQREGAMMPRLAVHYSETYSSSLLSLEELVLVEPMTVGYHAGNRGRIEEGDTALVIGCGTIGTGVIAAASWKGAEVIALDIDEAKLANAREFGARHTVNSAKEEVPAAILHLTREEGVNVAIEAVGAPSTYRLAVDAVQHAGRVVYLGYSHDQVCYDTTAFVVKELDIIGSRNALGEFADVIEMMEQRTKPFVNLITETYPLSRAAEAFRDWEADPAGTGKILIDLADTG